MNFSSQCQYLPTEMSSTGEDFSGFSQGEEGRAEIESLTGGRDEERYYGTRLEESIGPEGS